MAEVSLGDTVAGSAQVPALGTGESATVDVALGKGAQGSCTVSAVVDPKDTVTEQDEGNNSLTAEGKLAVGRTSGTRARSSGERRELDCRAQRHPGRARRRQQKTLSLFADGKSVQKVTLSSKHSWLYGNTDQPEGLTNTPG